MSTRFTEGAAAYDKNGRSYTVEEVDGGMVYCIASNGVESEFPEESLMNEVEWTTRSDGRRDGAYARIKQSRAYHPAVVGVSISAAEKMLKHGENLFPGLLDFIAFSTAARVLRESHEEELVARLSIIKCREVFDSVPPEVRVSCLAKVLGVAPEKLAGGADLGDNLLRAMIEKGIDAAAFDEFQDRPRK
ncbi:MAG TPA: hypothetical protein DGZ24_05415 [Rhodospirillaceae bacterium]|nr:hypothetical protein [Candidatus Neomarinimicrobiota bacterium]HCX14737.1 hypothetical protein [Rhodospirillaceae bacterium]|tara:strand:- start:327 stop:896 length:570 start_codon:yes stop_codon:yes gene_type:complete